MQALRREDRPPPEILARYKNRQAGELVSELLPQEQESFEDWYGRYSQNTGLNPDPDPFKHQYDYRGWYQAMREDPEGYGPVIDPNDRLPHGSSKFKMPGHPNRYVAGVDTISGAPQVTVEDLENPAFLQLPPEEQMKGRREVFQFLSKTDPVFRALPLAERQKVLFPPTAENRYPTELEVGKMFGLNIPTPPIVSGPLSLMGEGFMEEVEYAKGLPGAWAEMVMGGPRGRVDAALRVLGGIAAPFNFATVPFRGAAEYPARQHGLSDESARVVGYLTEIATVLGAGKLAQADKLTPIGKMLNEVIGIGVRGENYATKDLKRVRRNLRHLDLLDEQEASIAKAEQMLERDIQASRLDAEYFLQKTHPNQGVSGRGQAGEADPSLAWKQQRELEEGVPSQIDPRTGLKQGGQPAVVPPRQLTPGEVKERDLGQVERFMDVQKGMEPKQGVSAADRAAWDQAIGHERAPEGGLPAVRAADEEQAIWERALADSAIGKKVGSMQEPARPDSPYAQEVGRALDEAEQLRRSPAGREGRAKQLAEEQGKPGPPEGGGPGGAPTAPAAAQPVPKADFELTPTAAPGVAKPKEVQPLLPETPQREIPATAVKKTATDQSLTELDKAQLSKDQMELGEQPRRAAPPEELTPEELAAQAEMRAMLSVPEKRGAGPVSGALPDEELAPSTYIRRHYVGKGKRGIRFTDDLHEEYGGWMRWHKKDGFPSDELAQELFDKGILQEPTERALLEAKGGRNRGVASEDAFVRQSIDDAVGAKIKEITNPAGELEYKGKTYSKATNEGGTIVLEDGKTVVVKKPQDILQIEEKAPFDVPRDPIQVAMDELPDEFKGVGFEWGPSGEARLVGQDLRDTDPIKFNQVENQFNARIRELAGRKVTEIVGPDRKRVPVTDLSLKELFKRGWGSETGAIGRLTPEQARIEAEARASRKEAYSRIEAHAAASGKTVVRAGEEMGFSPTELRGAHFDNQVDVAMDTLSGFADKMETMNERARINVAEVETIAETGALPKELREASREAGAKPETFFYRMSEADVNKHSADFVNTGREVQRILQEIIGQGDAFTANMAIQSSGELRAAIKLAVKSMNKMVKGKFALGRAVRAYNHAPIPVDVIETFRRLGYNMDQARKVKQRLPIDTQLVESIGKVIEEKSWDALGPEEQMEFRRNLVDSPRLGLFSVSSALLDLRSNLAEAIVQTEMALTSDALYLAKGGRSMPSMQGIWRAMALKPKRSFPFIESPRRRHSVLEEKLGYTALGEPVPGRIEMSELINPIGEWRNKGIFQTGTKDKPKWGAFTKRETQASAFYDTIKGSPLYMKATVDTGFKRWAANSVIWREAYTEAAKRGLTGADRELFMDRFYADLPVSVFEDALETANKAGYNRQLTKFEQGAARSPAVKLMADAFVRWGFQFGRWAGDMLGAGAPRLGRKWLRGELTGDETARYLTRMATGWGGVYLVDRLYNQNEDGYVDYSSMEWIDRQGNRTRLSGQEPLLTALFLTQVARGDIGKATGAARHVSIPFIRWFYAEGGLLGSMQKYIAFGLYQGKFDTKAIQRETDDILNRMIPGQAVLATIKTAMDPTLREGFGKNVPLISYLKEPRIDLSTGEPVKTRQRFLGVEFPSIAGTPIPGATRLMPPISKLLSRYGLLMYRGIRSPIAGYRPSEAPEEVTREWQIEVGKARNLMLSRLIPAIEAAEMRVGKDQMQPGSRFYERMRQKIQQYDSMALRHATNVVNRRHLRRGKLPRRPTIRERRIGTYQEDYNPWQIP